MQSQVVKEKLLWKHLEERTFRHLTGEGQPGLGREGAGQDPRPAVLARAPDTSSGPLQDASTQGVDPALAPRQ